MLLAARAHADTIVLHDGSSVHGSQVTLGDVADLEGHAAVALADVKLGVIGSSNTHTFTLAEIRDTLTTHNVHWGKIDLRGPTRLTVRLVTLQSPVNTDTTAAANPIAGIDAQHPVLGTTLRQFIIARVQDRAGGDAKSLHITLQQPDDAAWEMTDAQYRFEIEPASRQTLGRLAFNVRCYKQDQLDSVQHLSVDVTRRAAAVVTARTVQRGQIIVPDDLTTKTLDLDTDRITPLTDAKALVGQSATRLVRTGTILSQGDIAPRMLVDRGQLVSVRAVSGGIVVKFTARAYDNGAAGDTIQVRNTRTNELMAVRVTGPQETEMTIKPGSDDPNTSQPVSLAAKVDQP